MGMYGSIAAHCSDIVCGGWHYPAYSLPEWCVYRLQRALPASHTLSYIPILSHNLSRGTSGFVVLRRDKPNGSPPSRPQDLPQFCLRQKLKPMLKWKRKRFFTLSWLFNTGNAKSSLMGMGTLGSLMRKP